ncbi:hypothetical protein D3C75_648130 [compost metagenome]
MLAQRNDGRSLVRSKMTSVAMGTTMEIASVIRKMPMMKPMIRKVGNAMRSARLIVERAPFYLRGRACKPALLRQLQLE